MKRLLGVLWKTIAGLLGVVVLTLLVLAGFWLFRREDPTAFMPHDYTVYIQAPSIRDIYDRWLNLEAVDLLLARPELSAYRRAVADARGLALTSSPVVRTLLDVQADLLWLKEGKPLIVLDLGWRGIVAPLGRIVGPQLRIPGFSFLNDSGVPMYRYTSGDTTIHAALVGQLAVVGLDAQTVKDALARRELDTGLAAKASRELLKRIRLRDAQAMRVMVDTAGITRELLSTSPLASGILQAVRISEQSMLDIRMSDERLTLGAGVSMEISLPELAGVLGGAPAAMGVLRYVPATAYLLTVSNFATLGELYPLVAAIQGKDVTDVYRQADSAARTITGMGIEDLLFSWVGAEVGAFFLPESAEPVFFARVSDSEKYERALDAIAGSVAANKDSTLVLDQVRIDLLSIPPFVGAILSLFDANVPEPYFIVRGNYFFLSLEAANLAAVGRAADTGSSLMQASLYADLTQGIPADPALLVWYDVARGQPFFLRGSGLLSDVLRLYSRGLAIVRATPTEVRVALSGLSAPGPRRRRGRRACLPLLRFRLPESGLGAEPLRRGARRSGGSPCGRSGAGGRAYPGAGAQPRGKGGGHLGCLIRRYGVETGPFTPAAEPVPHRHGRHGEHASGHGRRRVGAVLQVRVHPGSHQLGRCGTRAGPAV
jgi:hypothetical protein